MTPEEKKARQRVYDKRYYETHCEGRKAYQKAYQEKHYEERKAYNKAYQKAYGITRKYGLTGAEYSILTCEAAGHCAICGKEAKLCIDHDHATGALRGLLCNDCNTGLGKLGDNVAGLQRAIAYLQQPPIQFVWPTNTANVDWDGLCK